MISLSISRANTTPPAVPLVIADQGHDTYVIRDFNEGGLTRDVTLAKSRWVDGAAYVSHRTDISSITLVVHVTSSSWANLDIDITTLANALAQYDYTITVSGSTGAPKVYRCMPASYSRQMEPALLHHCMDVVTFTIPCQP